MTARIFAFPAAQPADRSTIHVFGDRVEGFSVSHESRSGDSWGEIHGPYDTGQEAITAAYALNRDVYESTCNVFVCDAALQHACPDVGLPSVPGDF
jgi:hypothetical protein